MDNDFPDFGNPVIAPRVGDQYQAQIPPLIIDYCCQENDSEIINDLKNNYFTGLPIPITWVRDNNEKNEKDSEIIAHSPLPISPFRPWKAREHETFVLALYAFGKNLNNVKMFVKTKRMGEILCYYYGKFYRSSGFNRWTKGKKMKIKGYIRGEKIFAGWRRHELMSRLFLGASEDNRGLLREINIKYEEDKVSLEKYVFTLRRIVGIQALIEAISIGKGKKDLTRRASDPKKSQKLPPHIAKNPKPKEKKFSSLTIREIVQFITRVHLSKYHLNDLFWNAVWPRLLANGWHSEQPKYYALYSSKRSLVFIIPGIEKFSRRGLVKGQDYFDCVSDVLNKVASDPSLLEEKSKEKVDNEENEENETDLEIIKKPDNENTPKFTIVDTSLRYKGESDKVVEIRSLPVETASDMPIISIFSSESEQESSEEDINKSETRDDSPKSTDIQENILDTYENTESQEDQSSDGSLARDSPDIYEDDENFHDRKSRALIDINPTPLRKELEANGTSAIITVHENGDSDTIGEVAPPQASEQFSDSLNSRRQSSRNRPLTTKALEAIAYGFLTPNRKRKNIETKYNNNTSRPSRPARYKVAKCSSVISISSSNGSD